MKYFQTWEYKYTDQLWRQISSFICNHLALLSQILDPGIPSNFYFLSPGSCLYVLFLYLPTFLDSLSSVYCLYLCLEIQILCLSTLYVLSLFVTLISNHTETVNFFSNNFIPESFPAFSLTCYYPFYCYTNILTWSMCRFR